MDTWSSPPPNNADDMFWNLNLVDGSNPSPAPVEKKKIGWISPAYIISRRAELDPNILAANRCVAFGGDASEIDHYRVLRTRILQRIREKGGNTVMVTSVLPGEGKTLAAINLSMTFAREFGHTALLVDSDLRRQQVREYLGIDSQLGLIDYLIENRPVSDLMIWPGIEKLTLISGRRTVLDSSELLGSVRMRELVAEMRQRYPERFVIFDVPAILDSADAMAFAPLVDHIVVLVRAGHTSVSDLNRAISLLPQEKLLGVVLNRSRRSPVRFGNGVG